MDAMLRTFNRKNKATDLIAIPSILKDMSRIVDMSGHVEDYKVYKSGHDADWHALKRDYWVVMNDIREVSEEYGKTPKQIQKAK